MKRLMYLLFLLPLLTGCRKTEQGFDMTYRRTFTIPVGLSTFDSHFFLFKDIPVDTAVFFPLNGATSDQIGQVAPRSMNIRLVFNGDGNLNFIRRIEVSLFDTQTSASSEKVAFYNDDVLLSNSGQIQLVPFNSDARKLFLSGNGRYNLRVKLNLREIPTRSYDVEWNATFLAKT
ncbi:MAG: hypothetical protein U5L45_26615 [Saprospiraceae bacterium]|nr:hypothetical protein [Saprospiraceae bacterium]